jgi:hypothetical protein
MIIDNLRSKLEWLIGYSREYEQIIHNEHSTCPLESYSSPCIPIEEVFLCAQKME